MRRRKVFNHVGRISHHPPPPKKKGRRRSPPLFLSPSLARSRSPHFDFLWIPTQLRDRLIATVLGGVAWSSYRRNHGDGFWCVPNPNSKSRPTLHFRLISFFFVSGLPISVFRFHFALLRRDYRLVLVCVSLNSMAACLRLEQEIVFSFPFRMENMCLNYMT